MINRSWGVELWDQFDNVTKYTEKSVQFCERYEAFLKDRCALEDDYAKALKKLSKTYTPKPKEYDEFYNKYSYTVSFCSTLKELQDIASQHEIIADNLRERAIKHIQVTIKECREQRKKCLDEYAKIKRQLDKQHDTMIKSLRKYEECHESARRAKETYEKAHEDLDLSRAQLEKTRDVMTAKTKVSDDAHANYASHVSLYNDAQRSFYERQLPSILCDLQQLDGKRSSELKRIYAHSIQSHMEVLPRVQRCLEEMSKQAEQLSPCADAQVVINEYQSGYTIPDDQKPIDLNAGDSPASCYSGPDQQIYREITRSHTLRGTSNEYASYNGIATIYAPSSHLNGTQTLSAGTPAIASRKTSGAASTIRKLFGSSTQRKASNASSISSITINAPFGALPPAQRIRKFQEQILNCKNELERTQKAREGLVKMRFVFQENPKFGDEQDVAQQIVAMDETMEKLHAEIKRFESYIAEIERMRVPNSSDIDLSSRSRTSFDSDQSIGHPNLESTSQSRSSSDIPEPNETTIYDQSKEFHCLPSITSMTVHQLDTPARESTGSFEDEDADGDQLDGHDHEQIDQATYTRACVLYDFTGQGNNGCQYVNAATIGTGEYVDILEDDHGDGWTRIRKLDGSTGFVPSSYLRLDSDPLPESAIPPIDSGRF